MSLSLFLLSILYCSNYFALLPGGDVVFVGNYDYLPSTHPASSNKILVTRTDANLGGKEIHTYEGNGVEEGHGITTDDIGNVYISGQASSTDLHLSFGLPASYRSAYTGGPRDMYIARLNGTPLTPNWFTYYGSTGTGVGDDVSTTLAYDNVEKSLYAAGLTTSTNFEVVNVPNIPQDAQAFPSGNIDGAIIKFGCNSNLPRPNNSNARIGINGFENDVEEEAVLNKPTISLYPNPFADELSILVNGKTGNDYLVEIYDTKGLKLFTVSNVKENMPVSLKAKLGSGFYIVKIISDNFVETKRIEKFE